MRNRLLVAGALWLGLSAPVLAHGDHHHDAPHGGQVRTVQQYHVELVPKPGQLLVYLLDDRLKTLPVQGRKGEVTLQRDGKTQTFALQPGKEAFSAPVDLSKASRYVAVVSLTIDGKLHRVRFAYPAPHHH